MAQWLQATQNIENTNKSSVNTPCLASQVNARLVRGRGWEKKY